MPDNEPEGRGIAVGILLFIVGCVVLVLSLQSAFDAPTAEYTGPPVCDGEVMTPGTSCIVFSGPGDSGTYEEILAHRKLNAKADTWWQAEQRGFFASALMLAGVGLVVHFLRLSRHVGAIVALLAAALPLSVTAVLLWPLQVRTNEASAVPVGVLGDHGPPFSSSLFTLAVMAVGVLLIIVIPHSAQDVARDRARQGRAEQREQTRKDRERLRREARERFDQGETDDPWDGLRPSASATPAPATRAAAVQRMTGALGGAVVAVACVLAVEPRLSGRDLPSIAPGLLALVGYALVAVRTSDRPYGHLSAWRWATPALLSLTGAVAQVLSMPPVSWSALVNTVIFASGSGALTVHFGASLPNPPLAGRLIYADLGLLSLLAGAQLVLLAADRETRGALAVAAYVLAGVAMTAGSAALGSAKKTESRGAVPPAVSAACHAAVALVLGLAMVHLLVGGRGVLLWTAAGVYAIAAFTQVYTAWRMWRPTQPTGTAAPE